MRADTHNIFVSVNTSAITTYCNVGVSGPAPTLPNANTPVAQTGINAVTTFTCANGYQSYLLGTSPYYTCLDGGATSGIWSSVYYSCIGALYISIYHIVRVFYQNIGPKIFKTVPNDNN